MFDTYRKDLYFKKLNTLYREGVDSKKIFKFDSDFYKKLEKTFVNTIPLSLYIKYLKPNTKEGDWVNISLYMFIALDNVKLVRANNKNLEYNYGKESSRYGWVEDKDYVYDPTLLAKIDKKLYYKMFMPSNIERITKSEYLKNKENKAKYEYIKTTKIEDFMPKGSKRGDLVTTIPKIIHLAHIDNDSHFKEELDKFLDKIQYNYYKIYKEELEKEKQFYIEKNIS